jgi:hypothetical protein
MTTMSNHAPEPTRSATAGSRLSVPVHPAKPATFYVVPAWLSFFRWQRKMKHGFKVTTLGLHVLIVVVCGGCAWGPCGPTFVSRGTSPEEALKVEKYAAVNSAACAAAAQQFPIPK